MRRVCGLARRWRASARPAASTLGIDCAQHGRLVHRPAVGCRRKGEAAGGRRGAARGEPRIERRARERERPGAAREPRVDVFDQQPAIRAREKALGQRLRLARLETGAEERRDERAVAQFAPATGRRARHGRGELRDQRLAFRGVQEAGRARWRAPSASRPRDRG
ncbi:MAG: hypothetical protein WDN30_13200 [Pararobbsia sp.]